MFLPILFTDIKVRKLQYGGELLKKSNKNISQEKDGQLFDGSGISYENSRYGVEDYTAFISNGMTNNEHIDAVDYYDEFLDEGNVHDDKKSCT
jgi:hypothetical protein